MTFTVFCVFFYLTKSKKPKKRTTKGLFYGPALKGIQAA